MRRRRWFILVLCCIIATGEVPAATTVNVENPQTITGNKTFTGVTTLGTTNVTGTLSTSGGGAIVASTLNCVNCVDMSVEVSTFNSSTLAGRMTDETGTGAAVFATAPTFTGDIAVDGDATRDIGTPQLRVAEVHARELRGFCPGGPTGVAGAGICYDPDDPLGPAFKAMVGGQVMYVKVQNEHP